MSPCLDSSLINVNSANLSTKIIKKLLLVLFILAVGRSISLTELAGFKSKAMTLTNNTASLHLNLNVSRVVNKFLHQQPVISKAGTGLL